MFNRDSRFPSDNRQTQINRHGQPVRLSRKPRHIIPVFVILAVAAGLYVYEMPERPWVPLLEQVHSLLDEFGISRDSRPQKKVPAKPRIQPKFRANSPDSAIAIVTPKKSKSDDADISSGVVKMELPIGMAFRPVGFRIGAVSKTISLSNNPIKRIQRFPRFSSSRQKYGVIKLGPGREFAFALDLSGSGYQMYLDRNRNGNLTDDGSALLNQGKGLFATKLKLPLNRVSGVGHLKGDYQLWIFTNQKSWEQGKMHYYAMTQLMGELMVKGKRYKVFLADNGPIDGDYRNDGVYIDLNRDNKISRSSEYFPRGRTVVIDGERYIFRIIR